VAVASLMAALLADQNSGPIFAILWTKVQLVTS